MANIRGFSDLKKKDDKQADGPQRADYYAGGVGASGAGSGVAIQMPDDPLDAVLRNAENAPPNGGASSVRGFRYLRTHSLTHSLTRSLPNPPDI